MKTKFKQLFTLLLFLVIAGTAGAQGVLSFSLAEAQSFALKNSYVIRNSGLDVEAARKKVWETIATGLPQVSGTANYSNFLNLPVSLIPGEFFGGEAGTYLPVKFGQDFNSDFGFTVNQQIFDGSYLVGVSSAKIYLQLSTQAKEKTEIEIRHAVAQAYYMALVAEENLAVMKENLSNTQKLESDTKAMYANGFVEEQDVDQMRLLVQRAENEILKAERELRVASMVLKYTLGVEMEAPIKLTDTLDGFVSPLLADESNGPGFDHASHIDFRLLDTQRQANQKLLLLEKSAYLPRIDAFYNWSKTAYGNNANLFNSSVPWFKSSMWGVNVTMPIFSSGEKMAKVRQAELEYDKVLNDQKQAVLLLQKDYLTAVADVESSMDQLKNDVDNKMLARRIYERTRVKYNNGMVSSTELSQTESQYIQAQGAWVASVMQLLTSKINLDKAIGK
ncbi:TolC family protein [Gaoshiqia sediminis]|uniref:TolC family protein n=1 Tax=Gaoshiqia sediminis TaxID=2986998 RepID=A0AA42CAJ5_9BACT|nr:TolC family protein [Gaoshiqia sediminis]MCW0483857.1 TolC family protein [Gaoshiqia sediminis]